MELKPINLIGGFYQDDNLPWSAQDTVNWIPRPAEAPGTISQVKLAGAPGLTFYLDIDDEPIRIGGMHNVEGRGFVIAGTTLYEIFPDGTFTARGTIPGAGPVTMEHNQLEFGNELSIGNGSGSLYVWNTWTSTFTVVADDAATGSVQTAYLNRRLIHMDPFGRFLYPSDIDNATSYDSLDRSDSEASPDKFVGLGVSQFELVGFSQRTIEFYSDTGATEQPFRPKRIAINRGCASRQSIVQIGGTLAWLGDDGIFYRLNGYQEQAISTGPVNNAIASDNWANCFGMVWEDRKHEVAYWTFPDGQTWGWDAWTGLIHRRESFGLNRWRINALMKWNGMWLAGDFQRGRLYVVDWEAYHEAGQPLVAMRTAPPIYNNGNPMVCPMIELVLDTGRGTSNIPGVEISGALGDALFGSSPTFSYTGSGGVPDYTFTLLSGALPTGLTLNPDGSVTGTRTAVGNFSWMVRGTDSVGNIDDLSDSSETTPRVNEVFEATLYTGTGVEPRTITTIDMPNGGSAIVRVRGPDWARIITSADGNDSLLKSFDGGIGTFPSATEIVPTGFVLNTALLNTNLSNYFAYSFARSAGFSDSVTWVGDGTGPRVIPHAMGSVPGCIIVSPITAATFIDMFHRSVGNTGYVQINGPQVVTTTATAWNNTSPTSSGFTVGSRYNANGVRYSALLLGHDPSASGFIACGSYVGNGLAGGGPDVTLGWQPQMVMFKGLVGGANQLVVDQARNSGFGGNEEGAYVSVSNNVFSTQNLIALIPNGFKAGSAFIEVNQVGSTYLYVAVRANM